MEHGVAKTKNKRNKLSFVCQGCRKSKTKCDKLKPSCTSCLKNGYACIYDVETQIKPKSRSKDSRIQQLRREIDYWRSKVEGYTDTEGQGRRSGGKYGAGGAKQEGDPLVNLHAWMSMIVVEGKYKHSISPFSVLSYVDKDLYLYLFWSSASPEMDAEATRQRIESVAAASRMPSSKWFVRRLLHRKSRHTSRYGVAELRKLCSECNSVEDSYASEDAYSGLLLRAKKTYEAMLPSLAVIRAELKYFYKECYPIVPVLEIPLFEEILEEILEDRGAHVKLNFGTKDIRKKLVHVCLLSCILGISALSKELSRARNMSLSRLPVSEADAVGWGVSECYELVNFSLSILNVLYWVDEFTALTHLYRYMYSKLSAELAIPGLTDPCDAKSLLCWYVWLIGLSGFPDDMELELIGDRRLLSLRRKLWLGMRLVCSYEHRICPKHTHLLVPDWYELLQDTNLPVDDSKVILSLQKAYAEDILEYNLVLALYRKQKQVNSAPILNLAFGCSINPLPKLSEVESALETVRKMMSKLSPRKQPKNIMTYSTAALAGIEVDFAQVAKSSLLESRTVLMDICVITTSSLYLYFESQLLEHSEPVIRRHYAVYFKDTIADVLKIGLFSASYLESASELLTGSHFVLYHLVGNAILRSIQVLFGIVLRLYHAEETLAKQVQEYKPGNRSSQCLPMDNLLPLRLDLIRQIKDLARNYFITLYELVAKLLSWTLFSCFKRFIALHLVLHITKEGRVMEFIRAQNKERIAHWSLSSNISQLDCTNILITADSTYLQDLRQLFLTLRADTFITTHTKNDAESAAAHKERTQ